MLSRYNADEKLASSSYDVDYYDSNHKKKKFYRSGNHFLLKRLGLFRRSLFLLIPFAIFSVLGIHPILVNIIALRFPTAEIPWAFYRSTSWVPALDFSSYTCKPHIAFEAENQRHPWTLHQVLTPPLNLDNFPWQKEWLAQGYNVKMTTSVDSMREDVQRLVDETQDDKYLQAFDKLPRIMEKIDMWKYVILYLEGGIYADMDVSPKPCLAQLMKSWDNDSLSPFSSIVFYETASFVVRFSSIFRFFMFFRPYALFEKMNWDTTVRIPQFRSALILAKTTRQEVYKQTLDLVVQRTLDQSSYKSHFASRNHQTLEVTGPGCFTDAIHSIISNVRKAATSKKPETEFYFIKREDCNMFFDHIATGTWR
jgi:hypothetical protein